MNFDKDKKWLAASCLQKSIRSGLTDLAIGYTDRLYDIERSYLLYRLSIIAVEDIGIANIPLINNFLSTEIKKDNIEKNGGKDYVLQTVSEMCESKKDRTAADMSHLASFISVKDSKPYSDTYFDNNKSYTERCLAFWLAHGSEKNIKHSIVSSGNPDEYNKIFSTLSENTQNILSHTLKYHREPHLFAIPLCEEAFTKEKELSYKKYKTGDVVEQALYNIDIYTDQNGNDWLSTGIDKHTSEGARALKQFINGSKEIKSFLNKHGVPYAQWSELIGHALFRFEGHQVNKRIYYPTAVDIMHQNQQSAFLNQYHISFNEIKSLIKNEINSYNLARKEVISSGEYNHTTKNAWKR